MSVFIFLHISYFYTSFLSYLCLSPFFLHYFFISFPSTFSFSLPFCFSFSLFPSLSFYISSFSLFVIFIFLFLDFLSFYFSVSRFLFLFYCFPFCHYSFLFVPLLYIGLFFVSLCPFSHIDLFFPFLCIFLFTFLFASFFMHLLCLSLSSSSLSIFSIFLSLFLAQNYVEPRLEAHQIFITLEMKSTRVKFYQK